MQPPLFLFDWNIYTKYVHMHACKNYLYSKASSATYVHLESRGARRASKGELYKRSGPHTNRRRKKAIRRSSSPRRRRQDQDRTGQEGSCSFRHRRPAAGGLSPSSQPRKTTDHGTLRTSLHLLALWHVSSNRARPPCRPFISGGRGREKKVTRLSHLAAPRTAFASATATANHTGHKNSETVSKTSLHAHYLKGG